MVGDAVTKQPEAIQALGVPRADVAVAQITPALGGEDAVAECDLALAAEAKLRRRRFRDVADCWKTLEALVRLRDRRCWSAPHWAPRMVGT